MYYYPHPLHPPPTAPPSVMNTQAMPTGVHVPPEVHVPPGATMSGPAHMASMAQVQGVCLMPVLMPVPMPVVMPGEAMTRPVAMDPMCMPGGARGAVSSPAELARWTAVHPTPFSGALRRLETGPLTSGGATRLTILHYILYFCISYVTCYIIVVRV